jgi:PAS domain S-box-containing protein
VSTNDGVHSEKDHLYEADLRTIIDSVPQVIVVLTPDGAPLYANQVTLKLTGLTLEDAIEHGAFPRVFHPDDVDRFRAERQTRLMRGDPFELEMRLRVKNGEYRWQIVQYNPLKDESGKIIRWYATATDIDARKRAEEALRSRELDARSLLDNTPGFLGRHSPDGTPEIVNRPFLQYLGMTAEEIGRWRTSDLVHPEDLAYVTEAFDNGISNGQIWDVEFRLRRFDGIYRWFQARWVPVRDSEGRILHWNALTTDIDDRKRAEETLRAAEFSLRQTINTIPGLISRISTVGEVEAANPQLLAYFGKSLEDMRNWSASGVVHPDDLPQAIEIANNSFATGDPLEMEVRVRRFDGAYRWFQSRGLPLRDAEGQILHWYTLNTDIDDLKRIEEKLRQSEQELRTITDTIRQPIVVLAPDGTMLYTNRVALDNSGLTVSQLKDKGGFLAQVCHPDDVDHALDERKTGLSKGLPFDSETRLLFKNGQYRWQLIQYDPLKDQSGTVIRWYVTATDIDDQKKVQERLHNENLVLREEIDRSSMFEEIVGSSKPVRQALKHVEKVAPSDSTVLILGETGTGKELIARALHRRSKRANRVFIRVNCAAIPQSLIASELFGHEKGAFTGALQRRIGRFEAANGGTLFLDEIGELPMETQIALLRVLQEKEFERVGSNHPISVDVRLVAATNRDLPAAVAAGTFRQDLFFRLNVFPIAVPSLQERADDIPLLVEYFVGRFAKESGKTIRHIGKDTLKQLQDYHWPGNIRELQNVVERAVILSESDTFIVDESWLQTESDESSPKRGLSELDDREIEMIEAALAETHGRISGPSGAAAKLGIPRQTLESKIRRLGIDRYGQKRPTGT